MTNNTGKFETHGMSEQAASAVGWDGAKRNPSIRCSETFEAGIPLHSIPAYAAH